MPVFKLFARFELKDSEENFIDILEENIESDSITKAENILENLISEKISEYSRRSLNWVLLEKCITGPEANFTKSVKGTDTGRSRSGQGSSFLLM